MDEALKLLLEEIRDDIKEIKRDVKTQNGRVRKLEVRVGQIVVVGLFLFALAGLLAKFA